MCDGDSLTYGMRSVLHVFVLLAPTAEYAATCFRVLPWCFRGSKGDD
jgi:hypothetical protein